MFSLLVIFILIFGAICAYLLGSINFAIIITKLFAKKDIRDFGSGNAGMTNVLRTVGKTAAAITLLGDFLKGFIAVFVMRLLFMLIGEPTPVFAEYIAVYGALIGHVYPIFYGFKGGKGILVSFGAIMVLSPISGLLCLLGFLITTSISRYISLGSIIAAMLFPVGVFLMNYVFYSPVPNAYLEIIFALPIGLFIIFLHRQNIKRLLSHTENKLSFKKKTQE